MFWEHQGNSSVYLAGVAFVFWDSIHNRMSSGSYRTARPIRTQGILLSLVSVHSVRSLMHRALAASWEVHNNFGTSISLISLMNQTCLINPQRVFGSRPRSMGEKGEKGEKPP